MIITLFLTFGLAVVRNLFRVLPKVDELPSAMSEAVAGILAYIVPFNALFPLDTLLVVLGLVFTFETGYLLFKLVVFVYKLLPLT